jgi:hypothetical protein
LVDEGLGEFGWVELLVVDGCAALASELLVAEVFLIDVDHF